MKRLTTFLERRKSTTAPRVNGDTPTGEVGRAIRLFCESAGQSQSGEEVLHLPVIVEAAESTPDAAREAASIIRKYLSKDNVTRPQVQYNAIMLVRILTDNPGPAFTRNLDARFVTTVKELLREARDPGVSQILAETLDAFEGQRGEDETLAPLIEMWRTEKAKRSRRAGGAAPPPMTNGSSSSHSHGRRPPGPPPGLPPRNLLPPPSELAARIEEARTSAKLLTQVVQSTPPHEVAGNELMAEFAERCGAAARSVQNYIAADDPAPPDPDTLLTLIETNDALASALSKHQRAILAARKYDDRLDRVDRRLGPSEAGPGINGAPMAAEAPVMAPAGYPPEAPVGRSKSKEKDREPKAVAKRGPVPRLGFPRKPLRKNKSDDKAKDSALAPAPAMAPLGPPGGAAPLPTAYGAPASNDYRGPAPIEADNPFDDRHHAPAPAAGSNGASKHVPPPLPLASPRGTVRGGVLVDEDGAPLATATGGLDLSPGQASHAQRHGSSGGGTESTRASVGASAAASPGLLRKGHASPDYETSEEEAESPVQVRQYRF